MITGGSWVFRFPGTGIAAGGTLPCREAGVSGGRFLAGVSLPGEMSRGSGTGPFAPFLSRHKKEAKKGRSLKRREGLKTLRVS